MQNTWSIDRTWKPRKGRSRPALMVEDNTTPPPLRGGGIDTTANETCGNEHERPQAIDNETRVHRPVPEPSPRPAPPRKRRAGTTEFAAVMAWGRRPVPFRTRKLRPSTAMVLHSEGCGRVAHRRSTTHKGPRTAHAATGPLSHTPTPNTHPEAHPAPTPPQARHDTNGDHQTDPEPCGHYQRCLGSSAGTLPGVGLCVYATRGPSTPRAQHRSRHHNLGV